MKKIVEFDSVEERNRTVEDIGRRLVVLLALFEDSVSLLENIDLNDPNTWQNDGRFCLPLDIEEVRTRSECAEGVGEKGLALQHSVMLALADRRDPLPQCPGGSNLDFATWQLDANLTNVEMLVRETDFKRWSATSIPSRVAYLEGCRREASNLVCRADCANFRSAVFTHLAEPNRFLSMKDAVALWKKHVG